MRRSIRRHLGYTPINPDTSPMLQYNQYHWTYTAPQGMEAARPVNRIMGAPYNPDKTNVNKHRGVWVDLLIPAVYRIALAPQLEKLALGRSVPKTPVSEAAEDFQKIAPLIAELSVRDAWLAKVAQLGGFQRRSDVVHDLWKSNCDERFTNKTAPPLPLVVGMLFSYAASGSGEWKPFFNRCLKDGWNTTPHFSTELWSELLMCAGVLADQQGVLLLLDEMLDVNADIEHLTTRAVITALNAIEGKSEYDAIKKYLFHFSERKVQQLSKAYISMRTHAEETNFKANDAMFYHVKWHATIRSPRQFSPRQLYFDYKPTSLAQGHQNSNTKIDSIVKEKIEKWKEEGLLPADYEHTDKVYDKAAAYKNVMRQEKWKKWPKFLKSEKFGYHGDP